MNTYRTDHHGIAEHAAAWLTTLETGGAPEKAAFAAWLKESPRHVEEFLCATALSREFTGYAAASPAAAQAPCAQVLPLGAPVVEPGRPAPSRARRRWYAAAAAVAVAAVGLWTGQSLTGWETYSTETGEQRSFGLEDGSLVHLNTRSRVKVRMSAGARQIRLVEGEALFKVAPDSTRPFDVQAGETRVRAIGTEFNVYRQPQDTRVSVLEGRVGVMASGGSASAPVQVVDAGEQAHVDADGRTSVALADTAAAVAWRQRRLVFRSESLETIAAEFNRYNKAVQIRIEGLDVRARRLSGVFDADDPESLVQFLTRDSDLQFRARGNSLIVWLPRSPGPPQP